MNRVEVILIFLLFISYNICAQNEGNIWYFGENAGLDFNSGAPIALIDGQLNTLEGCASISDNNGDLLFYTDGMTVYNKNHIMMPNGLGLLGHNSSTQSAIIIKKPGSMNVYYIFTVDGMSGNLGGLNYSEVDMLLDGGLGDVNANKNVPVVPSTCEKITAIKHQNGSDFWVVVRLENSNTYHSYLLTSTGVNMVPVITNIGPMYFSAIGYLRSSPGGDKVASANYISGNTIDIFDFNNATGVLTNMVTINNVLNPYGIEFSPDGKILYTGDINSGEIYQYNLLAPNIEASQLSLGFVPQISLGAEFAAAFQLGPDNKIYIANILAPHLSVINNPNVLGLGCNFDPNGVDLGGRFSLAGLPTFYGSIFLSNTVNFINICYGDSTYFTSTNTSLDSLLWDFGDVNSGLNNISTDTSTFHIFSDTGSFDVTLYSYLNNIIDTFITSIYIYPLPNVNLGVDTAICDGDILLLDVGLQQGSSYLWNDNSTDPSLNLFSAGDYSVIVTDSNGCINNDTIHVFLNPLPDISLGDDIEICESDDILTLDAYLEGGSYLWNNNSTMSTINIDVSGVYSLILTDSNGCSNSDTINVIINPLPTPDFIFDPEHTDLSNPDILFTNISSTNISNQWNLGDGTIIENVNIIQHTYQAAGEYDVSLISQNEFGCVDTIIYQIIIDPAGFDLFIPNTFTPNNDDHNELFVIHGRYIMDYNIKIFNRWGKKIFESESIDKYWDGRFQGELVQQDKYTYLITVLDMNGDTYEFTGIVNVIF